MKALVGDTGQARKGALSYDKTKIFWRAYASIFSPVLAETILAIWAPGPPTKVLDPFAGGGTRAIMACRRGYKYTGIELRRVEARRVKRQAQKLGYAPTIHVGDAEAVLPRFADRSFGFLLTCPPYYNLEQYRGGHHDLSMSRSYDHFLAKLRRILAGTYRVLRPGSRAVWVVGNFRDNRGENRLIDFRGDLVAAATGVGFALDDIAVVKRNMGSAACRVGNSMRRRRLVRVHEYAIVFQVPWK